MTIGRGAVTVTHFERVTYRTQSARRTVLLEVTGESDRLLAGYEVDREGDRIQPPAAYLREQDATDGQVLHVIDTALIGKRTRLVQDYLTGGLVPDGTASQQRESLTTTPEQEHRP